jgi:hypothetical protein
MFTLSTTFAHAAVKANVTRAQRKNARSAVKVTARAEDASSRREAMSLIAVRRAIAPSIAPSIAPARAKTRARDAARASSRVRPNIARWGGAATRRDDGRVAATPRSQGAMRNEILTAKASRSRHETGRDDARDVQAGVRGVR